MSESLLLAPITQPGGLYPDSPPRIKKPSKGSKIRKSKFKQQPQKFAKRPELPPISYHVTPYENRDNPPEYKRTGGRFWKVESGDGNTPFKNLPDKANRIYEHAYQSAKKRGLSDERAAKSGWGAVKNAGYKKKGDKWVKAQTPHEQDDTPGLQPREPLMRMTTPDDDAEKEQRLHEYKSPFPGRKSSPNFPERDPGETDTNPADLTLEELRQREKKAHPDLSDEEIDELVKMHIRELGPPSDEEHQEDYKRSHSKASRMLHFGVDTGIPISHRFRAVGFGDSGDIKLIGTFLDYETTTNGWHIDPEEESNIVDAPTRANVTVRVAHSKEPERVVGKYTQFQANEDDGCTDAYGKPLGRHIDFEAVVNPQDPQLRTNILKGWVNDISPGLDAEVFCGECGEPWGLEQTTNKLLKTCEHQDAEGILRNIKPKEGSIVTEPAFEGRTQFHPTFTFGMAMNQLFSPDEYESEPVVTRPRKGWQANDDRRQTKGGIKMTQKLLEGSDASKLATRLYNHGFFTASEARRLQRLHFLKAEDEDEDEDKGEDEDEDARIRAAFPLIKKAMKRAATYEKSLGDLFKKDEDEDTRMEDEDEDQHKYAEDRLEDDDEDEDRTEDEDEDEDRAEDSAPDQEGPIKTPGDPNRDLHDLGPANKPKVSYGSGGTKGLGPGQLGGMKLMSKEERATVLAAQKILAHAQKEQLLGEANAVLAKQKLRKDMAVLEAARKRFEQEKDTAGVKAVDEHIAKIKAQLEPKVEKTVQGAQVAPSTPTMTTPPKTQGATPPALRTAFNAEILPVMQNSSVLGQRIPAVAWKRFVEGMQQ